MKYLSSEELSKFFQIHQQPFDGMRPDKISQLFGENGTPFYKDAGMLGHNGVDYALPIGTPLYALFEGVVKEAKVWNDGGKGVYLASKAFNADGQEIFVRATYWHLEEMYVQKGDYVSAGQLIGLSGNTGRYTTGPHLHLGIKPFYLDDGKWEADTSNGYFGAIDPLPLFSGDEHVKPAVDKYYNMVFDGFQHSGEKKEWFEYQMGMFKEDKYVKKIIGRKPTERELIAMTYGQWPPHEIKEWNQHNWHNRTYPEFRAKILQAKLK